MDQPRRDHSGVLILQAWVEPGHETGLRVRISRVIDHKEIPTVATIDVDDTCDIVRDWLIDLVE